MPTKVGQTVRLSKMCRWGRRFRVPGRARGAERTNSNARRNLPLPRHRCRRQSPHRRHHLRKHPRRRPRTPAPGPHPRLRRRREKKSLDLELPSFGSNRRRDVLFFTQELSTLLNSGVPLDRALSITTELTTRPQFRGIVSTSCAPSKAANRWPTRSPCIPLYFSDLFINMVRAGEASGSLGHIFDRLSVFERSRDELRSYIVSSMIYPSLLALLGAGSIFVLLDFVVPRFASIFDDSRMKIPVPRRSCSKAARSCSNGVAGGADIAARPLHSGFTPVPEQAVCGGMKSRLKIPLLGDAMRKAETSRFARAMSTLVGNTVPLVQSLQISAGILVTVAWRIRSRMSHRA